MAINFSAIAEGAKSIAAHRGGKGTALATLVTGGLIVATAAGVTVPAFWFTLGPIAGLILYKVLPKNIADRIDGVEDGIIDAVSKVPSLEDTFPGKDGAPPTNVSNINKPGQ